MDSAEAQPQTGYGHPTTAILHVLFKVVAILLYVACTFISETNFVINFVLIAVCLMLDFWIVRFLPLQTKNISGRLLVGLRYWNEVTDNGSNWRFESLAEGQRVINKKDSACFWWALYLSPLVWILMGVGAILGFNIKYLLVVVVAVVLSGSNVVGFTRCSKEASKQIRDMASNAITSGISAAISRV